MTGTSGKPLGIIAGGGPVPRHVANAATRDGRPVLILGIGGEADQTIEAFPHAYLQWGQIGRMQKLLNERDIEEIVLIGNINIRPDFRSMKLDLGAVKIVPKVLSLMTSGDSDLLSGVIKIFGELGYIVVGAHEIAPDLTVGAGPIGRHGPDAAGQKDAERAMIAARAIGAIDAGQAAVAINGRIVALEAAEGTDAMLERVAALREKGRLRWSGRAGVLAKCAKPQQDLRVDMPTIGLKTIQAAVDIGLAGIAVEAGRAMLMDRAEATSLADDEGLFVIGEPSGGPSAP
ncbi:LpxI family protein [Bauldia sp.]|uniref:LpxI family protein n=1 Tax=Bauldia sp. TaxID=2575872 RepID=UPI003BAD523A